MFAEKYRQSGWFHFHQEEIKASNMTYDSDHDMSQASPLVHTTEPQIVVAREVHTHPLQDSMERPTTAPLAASSQDHDKLGELLKLRMPSIWVCLKIGYIPNEIAI